MIEPPTTIVPSFSLSVGLHGGAQALRLVRPGRLWPALLLLVGIALIAGLLARYSPDDRLAAPDFFAAFGLTVLAIMAIGYGSGAIRSGTERGALSLYLLRPRGTIAWPLGTWLATSLFVAAASLCVAAATLGTAALTSVAPDHGHIAPMLTAAFLCGLSWTSIAMATAAFSKRGAALCVLWFIVMDAGLSRAIDMVAVITPGPALRTIIALPPEHMWLTSGSLEAIGRLLLITAVALGLLLWRINRDEPAT